MRSFLSDTLMRPLRSRPYHVAAALLFVVVAAVYYLPYLHALPTGIHTWAQSDRLSLALNFYDYGLPFLTPRTSSLVSIGGVTGVEFPIQAYLAALGGVVFGRNSIVPLFRLLDVAMTVTGFFYLFRLVFERTNHFVAGLVPGAFLLASPFYAFYAGSFLPDPFSLSLSFIGYYYWFRFFENRQFPDLRLALLVLTLAGLVKTTTALHLGAVVGITLLWAFLEPALLLPRHRRHFLLWAGVGFGAIVAFFLHNQYLNNTYRSWQFLSSINPILDPETQHDIVQSVRTNWLAEYATTTQYRTLAVCGGLLLVFLRPNLRRYLPLTLLLLASVVIAYLFVQLMGSSLGVHDYYLICSFIPPAVLLLVLALLNVGKYTGPVRYATSVGLAALVLFLGATGYKRLNRRMSDDYPPFSQYYTHLWMRGGAEQLQRAGVPQTATILVINEAVNTGQVYFDRRGVAWQPGEMGEITAEECLNRMAADSLDYLVMPPAVYAQLAPQHAAFAAGFEQVGREPGVVLRRRDRRRPW
ncbi:glycosyltransferase family 39 protein [Hymenobacter sp. BT683]|uniref:Glycosyltransferase family 39 protein n=1 Tax=Hymenobacter jeongseonensis TaxID=2791027 RepID=A0ABS0IBU9_9BACT|nr:glycosyltransferase family 39 protein [Hymenobacter jeongseonensis]MBF9235839.1 glycosyltransferase family 39 protein [Hymenobacter jeongseonensis]